MMARADTIPLPQLSILDRLIDTRPDLARDPPKIRGQVLLDLRNSARRDLEMLLNTRQRCEAWPGTLKALDDSLFNYGIPDFTAENLTSEQSREKFRSEVELTIKKCEPRFIKVNVLLVESRDKSERTLRFRIEALMRCDPDPEPVVFDTLLDPASRSFAVRTAGDRE
jgi:type VI secretion system protein ImpF